MARFVREQTMEEFVRDQNLLRFRDLLLLVTDEGRRQQISRLIVKEEAKGGLPKLA